MTGKEVGEWVGSGVVGEWVMVGGVWVQVAGRRVDTVLSSAFQFMFLQSSTSTLTRTIVSAAACPVPSLLLGTETKAKIHCP